MAMGEHPILAALYDWSTGGFERSMGQRWRTEVLSGCGGRVLDLGCGTGANFPIWKRQLETGSPLELHAAEPDPHMRRRARRRAARLGLNVPFSEAPAERLPYPDGYFDAVVTTLVLCTVGDPAASLAEVVRVLKPGGEFRFMEHVRAEDPHGRWQDRLTPLWKRMAGGCHLNRETGAAVQAVFPTVTWREVPAGPFIGRVLLGKAQKVHV